MDNNKGTKNTEKWKVNMHENKNIKGTKNTEKWKVNMHENKNKTCMRTAGKEKKFILSTNHFLTPSMQKENHLGPLTNGNGGS